MSRLSTLVSSLRAHDLAGAEVALVLGSGLGAFADALEQARSVPYSDVEGMPASSVPGHAGRLLTGMIGGVRVLCQQGRVHLYEGYGAEVVSRAVRAFAALGCRALVLTNAAGGLRREWPPGTLMRITDHVNRQGAAPLRAHEAGFGCPYDAALGAALDAAAETVRVRLERGVYAGNLGPAYETPAEVRMLARLGCDAVGMSTVCEALAGAAAGMRVVAVSCITNLAAGISAAPLHHEEVIEVGLRAAGDLGALLGAAVPRIAGLCRG